MHAHACTNSAPHSHHADLMQTGVWCAVHPWLPCRGDYVIIVCTLVDTRSSHRAQARAYPPGGFPYSFV